MEPDPFLAPGPEWTTGTLLHISAPSQCHFLPSSDPSSCCKDEDQKRGWLLRAPKDSGGQRGCPQDAWAGHCQRTLGLRLHLPCHQWRVRLLLFDTGSGQCLQPGSHISDTSLPALGDTWLDIVGMLSLKPATIEAESPALSPLLWGSCRLFVLPLLILLKQCVIASAADPPPSLLPL